jgi:hypothetical protein
MTTDHAFTVRCKQIIQSLPIPRPFDQQSFFAAIAHQRGKHIELVPAPLDTGLPCGLLVSTDEVDYIVHRTDTTVLHALHTDMHELSHLLLGHGQLPDPVATPDTHSGADLIGAEPVNADAAAEALNLLLPHLSPRLIRRILGRNPGRSLFGTREEWEAETLGSLLMVEIQRPAGAAHRSIDLADHLAHLRPSRRRVPAGPQWTA